MILQETYTLSNGVEIPKLGIGTWLVSDDAVTQAVSDAVGLGYRHIDTARAYQNERGVGRGLRLSGVSRENIFVTSKIAAEIKDYDQAVASIGNSLKTLELEYLDLMLIHSPQPWDKCGVNEDRYPAGNKEVWKALEEAYGEGKIRAIGVSNFLQVDLDNILESCTVKPMVNQIITHITNTPEELIAYCQKRGILVEAYSPIAHGELLKNNPVAEMAREYGVSLPQLAVRYCLELGLLPIPKSVNPIHMKNNTEVDFSISSGDMDFLRKLEMK